MYVRAEASEMLTYLNAILSTRYPCDYMQFSLLDICVTSCQREACHDADDDDESISSLSTIVSSPTAGCHHQEQQREELHGTVEQDWMHGGQGSDVDLHSLYSIDDPFGMGDKQIDALNSSANPCDDVIDVSSSDRPDLVWIN